MDADAVREEWAERTGAYSPAYYAHHGADRRSEAVLDAIETHADSDVSVLELGCSAGRHLAHLFDHGMDHLAGVDVNSAAFEVLRETYPDLASAGSFYETTIEAALEDFEPDRFDVVYSVESLQHVHPDSEWVFEEVARITGDLLITVENEDGDGGSATQDIEGTDPPATVVDEVPLYFRDWQRRFSDLGFEHLEARSVGRNTLRVFRRPAVEE